MTDYGGLAPKKPDAPSTTPGGTNYLIPKTPRPPQTKRDDVINTIIAEGAGEGLQGMYAIGSVIANRAKQRRMTPEQIVNQPYQFAGRARPDLDQFVSLQGPAIYAQAQQAWQQAQANPMPGVDHYLSTVLDNSPKRPSWLKNMRKVAVINHHSFYASGN